MPFNAWLQNASNWFEFVDWRFFIFLATLVPIWCGKREAPLLGLLFCVLAAMARTRRAPHIMGSAGCECTLCSSEPFHSALPSPA